MIERLQTMKALCARRYVHASDVIKMADDCIAEINKLNAELTRWKKMYCELAGAPDRDKPTL